MVFTMSKSKPDKPASSKAFEQELVVKTRLLKNSKLALESQALQISDLEDEVATLRRDATGLRLELDIAENDIRNYLNSTSWKITKPVRVLRNIILRAFKKR